MIELPEIDSLERAGDDRSTQVVLHFVVAASSPYFEGHFPEVPLLPGVVQIGWALELARIHMPPARARGLRQFRALSSVKFMQVIEPGTAVSLRLSCEHDGALDFEYRAGGQSCSSGRMLFH